MGMLVLMHSSSLSFQFVVNKQQKNFHLHAILNYFNYPDLQESETYYSALIFIITIEHPHRL